MLDISACLLCNFTWNSGWIQKAIIIFTNFCWNAINDTLALRKSLVNHL